MTIHRFIIISTTSVDPSTLTSAIDWLYLVFSRSALSLVDLEKTNQSIAEVIVIRSAGGGTEKESMNFPPTN